MTDFSDTRSRHVAAHYAQLAPNYDLLWEHSSRFRDWMCSRILDLAPLKSGELVADIGGGTGIYAHALLDRLRGLRVAVVEPSAQMLEQVASREGITTILARAEDAAEEMRRKGVNQLDCILIKEAVHHFEQIPQTIETLAALLRPSGTMLIIMLPTTIEYPLFRAALDRFTELQPDPANVEAAMANAGLSVLRTQHSYELSIPRPQWLTMVENRFMSLLSTFTDPELEAGLAEIERDSVGLDSFSFRDTFEFLAGVPVM